MKQMSCILTIDVGNTDTSWVIFKDDAVADNGRQPTASWKSSRVKKIPEIWKSVDGPAIVASVLRGVPVGLKSVLRKHFPKRWAEYPKTVPAGLSIDIDAPEQVGPDRLATALGAWLRAGREHGAVIIDAGTAITVDGVTPKGAYAGGAIAAGIRLSFAALHEHTARLPLIEPSGDVTIPGRDTIQAMRAGVMMGAACLIEGLATRIAKKLRITGPWFVTGGQGGLLEKMIEHPVEVVPFLAHEGLKAAWEAANLHN
jgi:type III pantothenate kinase